MHNLFKIITLFSLLFFLTNCSNEEALETSRSKNLTESAQIENKKKELTNIVDSLNQNIDSLQKQKEFLLDNYSAAEADIFSIIKNSFLDHVIIGSENLKEFSELFRKLGFSIKKGKVHNNGLRNNFIEFADNSELELIEVKNPKDNFTKEYEAKILQNKYGLQFALRINEIDNLKKSFDAINSNFVELKKNKDFSILSAKEIDTEFPIFFIQFDKLYNSITNHPNKAKGISSIWFETKNIKKTAHDLVDIGFEPIGNYSIPTFNGKIVEFKNSNFKIILIESDKFEITGITISIENINAIKNILNNNFDKTFSSKIIEKGKSIFLPKEITNSIWLEFIEGKEER